MRNRPEPFFHVPAERAAARGRLVLLSYDFPPSQTAGALRWQKLAAFAAGDGWQLDVVTVHPDNVGSPDPSRLEELPPGTRVYGIRNERLTIDRIEQTVWSWYRRLRDRSPQPRAAHAAPRSAARVQSLSHDETSRFGWRGRDIVRAYYALLLRARERGWARRAAALARTLAEPGVHRALITCGPPHWVHDEARTTARQLRLPHVIDMRDPWSQVERLPEVMASPLWLHMVRRAEQRSISTASLVICNTQAACSSLQSLYPAAAERCIAVMNGFDEDPLPPAHDTGRFLIAYAGMIYLDRNPRGLFRGAARAIRELGLSPADIGIELMGNVQSYDGVSVADLAEQEGIAHFVHSRPAGSRGQAMEFLASAMMLVSLPQDSAMAIPSKVFEYMRFDAWLLALAETGSATEVLLRGTGADVVAPQDTAAIAAAISTRYSQFRRHGRPRRPALQPACSRRAQAEILFAALRDVTDPARRTRGPARVLEGTAH